MRCVVLVGCSPSQALNPSVNKPLKSVTHCHCHSRLTIPFPAAEPIVPCASTKLYCWVTGADVCDKQWPLVSGFFLAPPCVFIRSDVDRLRRGNAHARLRNAVTQLPCVCRRHVISSLLDGEFDDLVRLELH